MLTGQRICRTQFAKITAFLPSTVCHTSYCPCVETVAHGREYDDFPTCTYVSCSVGHCAPFHNRAKFSGRVRDLVDLTITRLSDLKGKDEADRQKAAAKGHRDGSRNGVSAAHRGNGDEGDSTNREVDFDVRYVVYLNRLRALSPSALDLFQHRLVLKGDLACRRVANVDLITRHYVIARWHCCDTGLGAC